MSEQILAILKRKLDDLDARTGLDAETRRNALKEELQYFVLNFIYHHPEYSKWIMYGGSALRICHGLNRMSVDLDFEVSHKITQNFLNKFKKGIQDYFVENYGAESDFIEIKTVAGRGLLLKFHIGKALSFGHASLQVHVKIDLNYFSLRQVFTERIPISGDQLSFAIVTYNLSTLMASKIAAIFLRGIRGVGKFLYEEKGRDIYDLLWYMNKRVVPNLDYLAAKGVEAKNPQALFDRLTIQMNKVSDANLKQDLFPLFIDRRYIENWLKNWRESYFRLLKAYKIHAIKELKSITVHQEFKTDNFHFVYSYKTEEGGVVRIVYVLSDYWVDFRDGDLLIEADKKITDLVEFPDSHWSGRRLAARDKLMQYAALFYHKTENYFKKNNRVMFGNGIVTKLIRMTADNLDQNEQIMLNKSALLSCELEDLLK